MRKLALLLVVAFLVNLPFVQEQLTTRALASKGREVSATVVATQRINGHGYVDYRLPSGEDPRHTRFSAAVDDTTYASAQQSRQLLVKVVPGKPGQNRPDGMIRNATFTVIAALGDAVLILVAMLWWRRRQRWDRHEVVSLGGTEEDPVATLRGSSYTVTAAVPAEWAARAREGGRVTGTFHLVAEHDLYPEAALSGLQQVSGARYSAHGQVVDTRAGWVDLVLVDGFSLRVETGPYKIRADVRDSTQATGLLCFTPRIG